MKNGYMKETHKGSGVWTIIVPLPKQVDPVTGAVRRPQFKETFHGSLSDAKTRKAALWTKAKSGMLVAPSRVAFGDYLDTWLAGIEARCRPSTVRTYRTVIDHVKASPLGGMPLQKVTRPAIQNHYAKLLKPSATVVEASQDAPKGRQRRALSVATVRLHNTVLGAALADALDAGFITHSPKPRAKKALPKAKKTLAFAYSAEECRALLATAEKLDAQFHTLLAFSFEAGTRKSETLGLPWDAVDLDRAVVHIRQQLRVNSGGRVEFGPLKDREDKPRTVSLSDQMVELLQAHKRRQAECRMRFRQTYREDLNLVFARDWNEASGIRNLAGLPLQGSTLPARLRTLAKAAGVRAPGARWHTCRHTCASLLLAKGEPVTAVADRLGDTVQTVLTTYAHVLKGMGERAAKTLGEALFG